MGTTVARSADLCEGLSAQTLESPTMPRLMASWADCALARTFAGAPSTAISWSYYGDRAVTYLFGSRGVTWYRMIYIAGFFFASFTDTTIIWTLSGIAIALMTIPNLFGILMLHKEMKNEVKLFWKEYAQRYPGEKVPKD